MGGLQGQKKTAPSHPPSSEHGLVQRGHGVIEGDYSRVGQACSEQRVSAGLVRDTPTTWDPRLCYMRFSLIRVCPTKKKNTNHVLEGEFCRNPRMSDIGSSQIQQV